MQIQSESAKIFYTQKRVGLHGKEIKIYKFRSMVPNLSSFLSSRILFEILAYKSGNISKVEPELEEVNNLLVFCRTPRTRKEICEYLGLSSVTYAIQTHVECMKLFFCKLNKTFKVFYDKINHRRPFIMASLNVLIQIIIEMVIRQNFLKKVLSVTLGHSV